MQVFDSNADKTMVSKKAIWLTFIVSILCVAAALVPLAKATTQTIVVEPRMTESITFNLQPLESVEMSFYAPASIIFMVESPSGQQLDWYSGTQHSYTIYTSGADYGTFTVTFANNEYSGSKAVDFTYQKYPLTQPSNQIPPWLLIVLASLVIGIIIVLLAIKFGTDRRRAKKTDKPFEPRTGSLSVEQFRRTIFKPV